MTTVQTASTDQKTIAFLDYTYEWGEKAIAAVEKEYSREFGCKVSNAWKSDNVISFTVENELDAYKAAHKRQTSGTTEVEYSRGVGEWLVTVRYPVTR